MRFHVVSLPHTQTTKAFSACPFTQKALRFASMMTDRGHEVVLYAGDENEARCTEHVVCITGAEQDEMLGGYAWFRDRGFYDVDWNDQLPFWQRFNENAVREIASRIEPLDFVCLITGWPQRSIVDAFPSHLVVEYGIGYEGVYAKYRVYESYAWMHCVYGAQGPGVADGRFFDGVVPNYYEVAEFPFASAKDNYCLFMSRMTTRKGYGVAIDATARAGVSLKVAGVGGDRPEHDHVEYLGLADTELRGRLMSRAKALLCPTLYLEPFGSVVVEALLCGTPVITTDWGAFAETVRQGIDGFRCRTMREFVDAIRDVDKLDYAEIRDGAIRRFSAEVVGVEYERYFERLMTLHYDGFYQMDPIGRGA
jgi:glycosyltransferase involved in cell wall biosynthesis